MRFLLLILILILPVFAYAEHNNVEDMVKNPQRYMVIEKWGFYVAARVAILHHVKIRNESSLTYKNVKVRVNYGSTHPTNFGNTISFEQAVLPITIKPKSTETYLRGGYPIGAGSIHMLGKSIVILSADAVVN